MSRMISSTAPHCKKSLNISLHRAMSAGVRRSGLLSTLCLFCPSSVSKFSLCHVFVARLDLQEWSCKVDLCHHESRPKPPHDEDVPRRGLWRDGVLFSEAQSGRKLAAPLLVLVVQLVLEGSRGIVAGWSCIGFELGFSTPAGRNEGQRSLTRVVEAILHPGEQYPVGNLRQEVIVVEQVVRLCLVAGVIGAVD